MKMTAFGGPKDVSASTYGRGSESGFLNNSRGTWGLQLHSVDPSSLARILQGLGFRAENSSAFRVWGLLAR